ncbi:hypothetical protein GCM10022397_45240 [Flavivirga jejuensis]
MKVERRSQIIQVFFNLETPQNMSRIFKEKSKPLPISKEMVSRAFKRVKSNKGVGGVDGLSLKDYEDDLSNNLYKSSKI